MARFWKVYSFALRIAAWFARQGALFAALFGAAYLLEAGIPGPEDQISRAVLVAAGVACACSAYVARSLRLSAERAEAAAQTTAVKPPRNVRVEAPVDPAQAALAAAYRSGYTAGWCAAAAAAHAAPSAEPAAVTQRAYAATGGARADA